MDVALNSELIIYTKNLCSPLILSIMDSTFNVIVVDFSQLPVTIYVCTRLSQLECYIVIDEKCGSSGKMRVKRDAY